MGMLNYLQILLIQCAIFCCYCKYIVQSDVTIQTSSSQWNDLISNTQSIFCTNEQGENYIGQATNSDKIQLQRTFNINPLTNKVYIYFEYQISGEWNDNEVEVYINGVKQSSEKIKFIDTNKGCNENFLFNSYVNMVYNKPPNILNLEIRVNKIYVGLYIKNLILVQFTQRGRGEILKTMFNLPICNNDQTLAHYYCKCNDALVYQQNKCIASCDQNYLYSLDNNQCYFKQHCSSCVGLNENLQCDQGYYSYAESNQDLPVCISKCPNNFYQDETTKTCLDYQNYLSQNLNSGYPVDYKYFMKNIPEFLHFMLLDELTLQIVSEPKRIKERTFFYQDNTFYVGSNNNFKNQTIQIQTIIKNPQHKVKFRATCHFIDFYPSNFEVFINQEKLEDIQLTLDTQNRIKQDKLDYVLNYEWTWQKSKEESLVKNTIQFRIEQPQQDGKYIGFFFLEDIHVYSFQCSTGCPSCFTETSCPPCTNPANKNPQDCTCLKGYSLQGDICEICPTYCTSCVAAGTCSNCIASTQRLNPPNCDQCPDQMFLKQGEDNCQLCQNGCLKCIELASCMICNSGYFRSKTNQCIQQCPDGYFNDSTAINDPKCTLCDSNCLKCDTSATNCTDCITDGFLVNSHCFICSEGQYFSGTACEPCINQCQNCISSICQKCLEGYFYMQSKNECQSICDDGYFGNIEVRQCQLCNANCKTCDNGTSLDCLSCYPGNVLNVQNIISGQCKITCLSGFYKFNDICFKCWIGCASCIDQTQNCLVCATNYYRLKSNGLCYSQCPDGYYNNIIGGLCSPCHPVCRTCLGLLPSNCLSCNFPLAYYQNQCLTDCLDGYGNVNNVCTPCVQNCKKCFGTSQNQCLVCAPGYYYLNFQCYIKCPKFYYSIRPQYICKCQFMNCISCTDNQYYFNNQCYDVCPQGYFGFNYLCNLCHITCKTCFGEDQIECLSCNNNLILFKNKCIPSCLGNTYHDILTNECKYCNPECIACNGPNNNNCLVCPQNKLLTMQGQCMDECPSDQYPVLSENKCYQCHSSCETCFGSSYQNCLTCQKYFYLFECVDFCPEGFTISKNQLQCEPDFDIVLDYCAYQCETCWLVPRFCKTCAANRAPNPPNCDCELGYFDDGVNSICLKCDNKCSSCKGLASNCIKCKGDRQYPHCTCPDYYYDDGVSVNCIRCQDNCQNCDSNGCTVCLADRINVPECVCQDGYYDSFAYYCQQCSQRCSTCDGTANLCLSCSGSRVEIPICKCPKGYFENSDVECQACDSTCIDCNQNGCLSCFGNRVGPIFGECKCNTFGVSRYNVGSTYCTDCSVGVPSFALNDEFTGFTFEFGGSVAFIPFETDSLCAAYFQPESLLKLGTNPRCDLEFNVYFGENPSIKVGDLLTLNKEFALSGCSIKFIQIIPMPLFIPNTIDKTTHKPNLKFKNLNNPNICESIKIEFDTLIFNGRQSFDILSWNLVLPPPPHPEIESILQNHSDNHDDYLLFPPKIFQSEIIYKFSVTVKSFALLQNTIEFLFQAQQKSSIKFVSTSTINQFHRYENITIPNVLSYINCVEKNPPSQLVYFEIYLNNFRIQVINGTLTENLIDGYQYDVPITFEPYYLNFNNPFILTYKTILTRSDYTVEGLSAFEFYIVPSSPTIIIQGGNRMIGFSEHLYLNASITDHDLTNIEAMQQEYECIWGCFDIVNGAQCQDQQQQVLEFNTSCSQYVKPRTFYAYTVSNFQVSIWKQGTKYSTTASIQFIEIDLPNLIVYGGNSEQQYNYYDELILTIQYPGVNPDLLMYAGAVIYDQQVVATFEYYYLQLKYKQLNYFTDLIYNTTNIVKLRLSVYDPRFILPSVNTQGLTMNIPPQNCSLSYQLLDSFVEFLDDMNVSLIGCQDDLSPLMYNVYLFPNRTIYQEDLISSKFHNFVILKSFQSSNQFKLNLPFYSDAESLLLFNIKDSKQGIVNLTLSINVRKFKKIDQSTFKDYHSNLIGFDDQLVGYVLITERLKQIQKLMKYKEDLYKNLISIDNNQTFQNNQTEALYRSISNLLSQNVTLMSFNESLLFTQLKYRIQNSYSKLQNYFELQKKSQLTSLQNLEKNDNIRLYYIFAEILSSGIHFKVNQNVTSDEILYLLNNIQVQLQSISILNEPLYNMIQNSVNLNFGYVTKKQAELIIGLNSSLGQPIGDTQEVNKIYNSSTNYYRFSITRFKDNPFYATPQFPKNSSGYQAVEPKLQETGSSQNSMLGEEIQFSIPNARKLKANTTVKCISQLNDGNWTVDICKTVKKDQEIICKCEKLTPTSVMEQIEFILDKGRDIFSIDTLTEFASYPFYKTIIFYCYFTITASYLLIVYWGVKVDGQMYSKIHIQQDQAKTNKNTVENQLIKNQKYSKYTKTGQLRDSSIEYQHALPLFKRNLFGTGLSYGAIILNKFKKPLNSPQNLQNTKLTNLETKPEQKSDQDTNRIETFFSQSQMIQSTRIIKQELFNSKQESLQQEELSKDNKLKRQLTIQDIGLKHMLLKNLISKFRAYVEFLKFFHQILQIIYKDDPKKPRGLRASIIYTSFLGGMAIIFIFQQPDNLSFTIALVILTAPANKIYQIILEKLLSSSSKNLRIIGVVIMIGGAAFVSYTMLAGLVLMNEVAQSNQLSIIFIGTFLIDNIVYSPLSLVFTYILHMDFIRIPFLQGILMKIIDEKTKEFLFGLKEQVSGN